MSGPGPDVSAQSPPPAAQTIFGANFERAQAYAALLCDPGVTRGLVGPREPERIWTRHLLNGAALAPWVPPAAAVLDVGSGAGLPGIALLLARPDLSMTLLEPMARRVAFCEQVRTALGLDFAVVHGRAQEAAKGSAEVVVARAVAPLDRLVELALPLLRPGGQLLALKGERAGEEARAAGPLLRRLGIEPPRVHPLGEGADRTYVVAVAAPAKALR